MMSETLKHNQCDGLFCVRRIRRAGARREGHPELIGLLVASLSHTDCELSLALVSVNKKANGGKVSSLLSMLRASFKRELVQLSIREGCQRRCTVAPTSAYMMFFVCVCAHQP